MTTDEEAARKLHLEINGCRRRYRGETLDQARLVTVAPASLRDCPHEMDADESEACHKQGNSLKHIASRFLPNIQLSLFDHYIGTQDLVNKRKHSRRQASPSPSVKLAHKSADLKEESVNISSTHNCYRLAAVLRDKAEKSSSMQCFYTKIREPRKVSSPNMIDNRANLAKFVNSMFSCEKIKCGQGANLDVVFVPCERGAASIRFPPVPEQASDSSVQELAPDGTTWSWASKNAAFVMLTQNEGMKWLRHPKLVH